MNGVLMKEFKLEDVLYTVSGKSYDLGNIKKSNKRKDRMFNFVGRTNIDNGVQSKIIKLDSNPICGNVITISQVGTIVALYQKEEFYKSQNIVVYSSDELNEYVGLYIVTIINKHLKRFIGYNTPKLNDLNNLRISLPVQSFEDTEPDYEYMEQYIKNIQDKVVQLAIEEDKEEMKKLKELTEQASHKKLDDVVMKEFELSSLFTASRGTRLKKDDREKGATPLITAGELNYGIAEYIKKNNVLFNGLSLTIDMFGNVFFRNYPFYADDNIIILKNDRLSVNNLLYIQAILSKYKNGYGYSKQFRMKDYFSLKINLPVKSLEDTEPDYEYMDQYIRSIYYSQNKIIHDFLKNKLTEVLK